MMMDVHRRLEIAEGFLGELLTLVGAAIKADDWTVDGACDPMPLVRSIHDTYVQIIAEAHPH